MPKLDVVLNLHYCFYFLPQMALNLGEQKFVRETRKQESFTCFGFFFYESASAVLGLLCVRGRGRRPCKQKVQERTVSGVDGRYGRSSGCSVGVV